MLLLLMMVGVSSVWAESKTGTITFGTNNVKINAASVEGNDNLDNSWTITTVGTTSFTPNAGYYQVGSSKSPATSITFTATLPLNQTISAFSAKFGGFSGTAGTVKLKVGDTEVGSGSLSETTDVTVKTSDSFVGVTSSNLTVIVTGISKGVKCYYISYTYEEDGESITPDEPTLSSISVTTAPTKVTYTEGEKFDPAGLVITKTMSDDNKENVTYSEQNKSLFSFNPSLTTALETSNTSVEITYGGRSCNQTITVNPLPSHIAHFSVNGTIDDGNNRTVKEGESITFPSDPEVDGVVFKGWTTAAIDGTQNNAPKFVNTASEPMGSNDVTYYAVFATEEKDGSQWKKVAASAVKSAGVYAIITTDGHAFNGTISSGHGQLTSTAFSFDANGIATSAPDGTCEITFAAVTGGYTMYNANNGYLYASAASSGKLAWHNTESSYWLYKSSNWLYNSNSAYLRDYQNSSIRTYGANNGSVIQFAKKDIRLTYSDYCTTVALDTKPTIVLSATELAEYAGNTNTSITARVSEDGYTETLTVASSAEAVATASISEGTITIQAHTAGTATITVTALAMTGFRENTATIAVTVSEKLAHGLAFSADALNLTVGDTEFTEPTLSNPNSLPVAYSLVYTTPEKEGKVATINAETGKITLADPSLSTETQGAVMVKASTIGDNSHAAGEVTYNLVVARKSSTTSWSNGGTAVTIDKDEIETLPTATNSANRNIQYESSNTDVATIDNTGAVTFANYGTTTITAKTSATAEYAATSATYELTFAPRYTVTFIINGNETVLREETTGAGVTAPEVEPIAGKVFCGWADTEINGTTNDKPAFVSTESLDRDKTLYAVFATASGDAIDVDITMNATSTTEDGVTISCAIGKGSNFPAWTSGECRVYASNTITISASCEITAFSLTFHKQGSKDYISSMTANTGTYTSGGSSTSGEDDKIDTWSGSAESITLTAGGSGQRVLVGGTVTVGEKSYSDYCTTIQILESNANLQGWKVFYDESCSWRVDENSVVYYAKSTGDNAVTLSPVEGKIIPVRTPVAIKTSNDDWKIEMYKTSEPSTDFDGVTNVLRASSVASEVTNVYRFGYSPKYGLGFIKFTGEMPANTPYLDLSGSSASSLRIVIEEHEEQTGLNDLNVADNQERIIDLQGRRILLNRGLVVRDGKVVLVK